MTGPLIDVTGRRRRRQRQDLLRRVRRIAIAVGVLAVVGALVWVVWASPVLEVRDVTVSGNQLASTAQVIDAAAVPTGGPLAGVDTSGIAARVSGLPPVAHAEVGRSWPNTVAITVTERTVRLVVARDSSFDWVDATGVVFNSTPQRPQGVMLGQAARNDPKILAGIVTVVNALPPTVAERTRTISGDSVDSLVLQLTDGSHIVWGSAEDSDLKAQVIAAMIEVKASVYDVSSPTHPTTRK